MPTSRRPSEGLRGEIETLDQIVAVGGCIRGATNYEELLERAVERFVPPGDDDDLSTLNFSGGTTGSPKAIMLRHRNLFAVAQNTIASFGIRPEAVFLNVRPLWPIAQVIMLSYVMAGARIVLGGRFDAERFRAAGRAAPAQPARRWCRRSSFGASITCMRAIRGSLRWRRSMSAARASRRRSSSEPSNSSGRASASSTA